MQFNPIEAPSATDLFVAQLKEGILTGRFQPGEQLPSERELESQLKVSRAVINQGLRRLQTLHFIKMVPRRGNFVADYRLDGDLTTLDQIVRFRGANYQPELLRSIYRVRRVTEVDTVRLATQRQNQDHLREAERTLKRLENGTTIDDYAQENFAFFRALALASENQVYPLVVNSFRPTYLTLSRWNSERGGAGKILKMNRALLAAIDAGQVDQAVHQDEALIDWSLQDLLKS